MSQFIGNAAQTVSPNLYGLILSSAYLREALTPEGLAISPYEILDYDATLVLHDARGAKATFRRKQNIRFLQNGVSAILDHAWGDGILLTNYHNTAGTLEDSFRDQGKRHLVIALKRRGTRRGDTLAFEVEREVMETFLDQHGWVETTVDHPVHQLRRRVIFPKSRPVQRAMIHHGGRCTALPIRQLPDGRTAVGFKLPAPLAHTPYTIRWIW